MNGRKQKIFRVRSTLHHLGATTLRQQGLALGSCLDLREKDMLGNLTLKMQSGMQVSSFEPGCVDNMVQRPLKPGMPRQEF